MTADVRAWLGWDGNNGSSRCRCRHSCAVTTTPSTAEHTEHLNNSTSYNIRCCDPAPGAQAQEKGACSSAVTGVSCIYTQCSSEAVANGGMTYQAGCHACCSGRCCLSACASCATGTRQPAPINTCQHMGLFVQIHQCCHPSMPEHIVQPTPVCEQCDIWTCFHAGVVSKAQQSTR